MKNIIKSIFVNSTADNSEIFYTTDQTAIGRDWYVHEIKEEQKRIYDDVHILVYRGYEQPDNKLIFEIESNSGLTIIYKNVK